MDTHRAPPAPGFDGGGASYWHSALGDRPSGERLPGPRAADVCIVGAGYTGLWTAYYLKRARPGLDVVVLEKEFPGAGASGRNGGWVVGEIAASRTRYASRHGRPATIALQRALFSSVDEVVRVAEREGIDAGLVKGGVLYVARNRAQLARLDRHVRLSRDWGWTDRDIGLVAPGDRIRVEGAVGAAWSPHCARVQPAALLRGLARAARELGVDVYERTPVLRIRPRSSVSPAAASTPYGTVAAEYVIRATEGFTPALEGHKRSLLPVASSMLVTSPLPPGTWESIGWEGRELLGDMAHCYTYAQRTGDDRIAFGGRGGPYRFGSRVDGAGGATPGTVDALWRALTAMFPAVASSSVEYAWSGLLGVPRDWCSSVALDHATGLGHAGGYTGAGLAMSNLAGRTLRDLLLQEDTPLASFPWVGWRSRRWEPEPLRWLGVHAAHTLYRAADAYENAAGRPGTSPLARAADVLIGH
ncbi:NAD(P)/FAD-dependent oxidoreductase [Spirillospora sp. CA-255316]